jgi:hypothetical protein
MGVYETPPEDERDMLGFLAYCIEETMERENEDWESMPDYIPDGEVIEADAHFYSVEYGVGLFVGPFRNEEGKIWSFVVGDKGIVKVE